MIKATLVNTKKMSYGSYKLTVSYGTGFYKAHSKYKDPCKERKTKTLDKGDEIIKTFDIYVKPNVYADLVNKGSIALEVLLEKTNETEKEES